MVSPQESAMLSELEKFYSITIKPLPEDLASIG
jgi:hypothetical protein